MSLEVAAGTVTGLLGPSGSGKTTLLRAIVGVQIVEAGTVRVLGLPAGAPPLWRRVGYVTQEPSVYGDMSVRENLRYFARILGAPPSRIDEAIDEVDLRAQADQLTRTLSGGERSRVSLATALLGRPELLVLDEPTVGLDPVLRRDLWALFHGLAETGRTLLVSSHVMDEAERCDELVLMRDGTVVAAGSSTGLLDRASRHLAGRDRPRPQSQLDGGRHRFSDRQHRRLARAGRRGVAVIDLRSLQRALGGEISGRQLLCPGPGHSPRDRSLAVRPSADGDGFVVHSHCGDAWTLCKDYVRERLGLPQWQPGDGRDRRVDPSRLKTFERAAVEAEAERRPLTQDDRVRIERARALWDEATDPRGTLAERYLLSRALALDDDVAGKVLRYHPSCPWRDENTGATVGVPALVAVFRGVDDDAVTAIQRVALTPEGAKIGRRMLGIVHRAAVKLDQAGDTLHVGEGVETMMAARQLGLAPAWALGSAGMVAHFPVTSTGHLRICGERDEASARAVELCTRRWQAAGRRVQVVLPTVGKDLNDELQHGDHRSRAGR